MSGVEAFKKSSPIKMMEKPIMTLPQLLFLALLEKSKGSERPIRGNTIATMCTLKPRAVINQAVAVVPILEPMTTPMDSATVMSPALTKLTNITVVADDD